MHQRKDVDVITIAGQDLPVYVDMNTRDESKNKTVMVNFGDKSRKAVIKALAPIASAVGYNLSDVNFSWTTDLNGDSGESSLILDYDVEKSDPWYWHSDFTFALQRNIGSNIFSLCLVRK